MNLLTPDLSEKHARCGCVRRSVHPPPPPDQVFEAIKAVQTDAGVLLVIKNYTGRRHEL